MLSRYINSLLDIVCVYILRVIRDDWLPVPFYTAMPVGGNGWKARWRAKKRKSRQSFPPFFFLFARILDRIAVAAFFSFSLIQYNVYIYLCLSCVVDFLFCCRATWIKSNGQFISCKRQARNFRGYSFIHNNFYSKVADDNSFFLLNFSFNDTMAQYIANRRLNNLDGRRWSRRVNYGSQLLCEIINYKSVRNFRLQT